MYKIILIVAFVVVGANADPKPKPGVLAAAPAVVTAQSSQIIARNYNTLAAPLVAASPYLTSPYLAAPYSASPYIAAPYSASPYVAAPYSASPYVAAPYSASPYVAAPYSASPYVAAPYSAYPYLSATPYLGAPGLLGRAAPVVAAPGPVVV